LYNELGTPLSGDPYETSGWERSLVKMAFNALVNAETTIAALRAIALRIGGEGAFDKARRLVESIEHRHPAIARYFGTGAGLRLMRRDSDMTQKIVLSGVRAGVPLLPIHDSYIVPQNKKGHLMEWMAESIERELNKNSVSPSRYPKNIPQYGDGCGPCIVDVVVMYRPAAAIFFADLAELDFFGGHRAEILAADLFGFRGGPVPESIRFALRHEMKRLSLRQADLAHRLGLRRSHFSNLIGGRAGASHAVAERIREFLVENAKTVGAATGAMSAPARIRAGKLPEPV
jgi:hypothetical protein